MMTLRDYKPCKGFRILIEEILGKTHYLKILSILLTFTFISTCFQYTMFTFIVGFVHVHITF